MYKFGRGGWSPAGCSTERLARIRHGILNTRRAAFDCSTRIHRREMRSYLSQNSRGKIESVCFCKSVSKNETCSSETSTRTEAKCVSSQRRPVRLRFVQPFSFLRSIDAVNEDLSPSHARARAPEGVIASQEHAHLCVDHCSPCA